MAILQTGLSLVAEALSFIFASKTHPFMEKRIKEVRIMVLFSILAIALILLVLFIALVVATGGATIIVVFGDVVVFVLIIALIVKLIRRNKK